MLLLNVLLRRLESAGLRPRRQDSDIRREDLEIDHVAYDSRAVGPNGLFVAVKGTTTDGHLFIDKAVSNGAIAILCETVPETLDASSGTVVVQVDDTRASLAEAAACLYDDPSLAVDVIGVTGTNGKTTTASLLYQCIDRLDGPAGLIGTIDCRVGDKTIPATHTTPDALQMQRLLAEMRTAGCNAAAVEVSSHAIAQARTHAIHFRGAVFTNLTQDHLDYHLSMTNYAATKKSLFDDLDASAFAVYNADDPYGAVMVSDTRAQRISYGTADSAMVRFYVPENRIDHLKMEVDGFDRTFQLVGAFNAYNIAAAYAALRGLDYSAAEALDALAAASAVPGRFERVFSQGKPVVVDYAHTPDALENVLRALRAVVPNTSELWCVFGCGGERDRGKRPLMGQIAETLADHCIVTDDNPRHEPAETIFADIRKGMRRPNAAQWIHDRTQAICTAIAQASKDDVVLVAGKGHESYQIIGDNRIPLDDREVVRTCHKQEPGSP